jgi:two-component system response regulator FlrC
MRGGACDFMLKPFEPKTLLEQIARYAMPPAPPSGMVAADPRTQQCLLLAARVARTDATVLLTGESGVGKEVFARYIHEQSPRAGGPFVAINCAAIPDNLLEATLFGHEKGAFTGAQTAQAGKFEQAHGGTLLLDEISEMPLGLQAKLLRVLQEREVERVGGKKPTPIDIRVLATSNRDMAAEVRGGRFREDLFYRLNVFPLEIPPLRARPGDILPLARQVLARLAAERRRPASFAADAEAQLLAYAWPGNVRELENCIQRALILEAGEVVTAGSLLLADPALAATPVALNANATSAVAQASVAPPVTTATVMPADAVSPAPTFSAPAMSAASETPPAATPADMKSLERQHILDTLARVGHSRKKAVAMLGISERTLRYKLQQYRAEGFLVDDDKA